MKAFLKRPFLCVIVIFAMPAGLLYFASESTRAAMMFNRDAIATGEWWRLVTGHWVHFGFSHLALNCLMLLVAGTWLEHIWAGALLRFALIAPSLIGAMLFVLEPAMHIYGGLSGIACGLITLLALTKGAEAQPGRIWWRTLLVAIALKIVCELIGLRPSPASFESEGVRVSQWAHAAGALVAVGFFLSRLCFNSCPFTPAVASPYDETHS